MFLIFSGCVIWLVVHQNANWSVKEGSLTERSRGMQWWKFLINVRSQWTVSFDSLAASWITPSPCAIPIPAPALAALLNKTDAPMNPTRSLSYTVHYLWHLVTKYSFEVSHWQQRSEQWQSHWPLQYVRCFCPTSSVDGMSPASAHTTALFWCCLER